MNYIARFLLEISNFDEVQTFYIYKNILSDINGYFEEDFPFLKKNVVIIGKYISKYWYILL